VNFLQDKSTIISVEVVRQIVNEMSTQKEKASILLPGPDVKIFLGEGDDIIQTNIESGKIGCISNNYCERVTVVFLFLKLAEMVNVP